MNSHGYEPARITFGGRDGDGQAAPSVAGAVAVDGSAPGQTGLAAGTEIWRDPARTAPERVSDLLSRMTLAEKMAQLHAMGIRHVATMHNFGCLDPALVERSMTLFAREVMPAVAAETSTRDRTCGSERTSEALRRSR